MEQDQEFYEDFCALIDYKLMKTVNDNTVSDPKPRMKKKAKTIRPKEELDEEAGPSAPKPKKEYRLEKSKKRKEPQDKVNEIEEKESESAKNLKYNRKTGKFEHKSKFQKSEERGRKFEKKFQKGDKKFEKKQFNKNTQKLKKGKPEWRG